MKKDSRTKRHSHEYSAIDLEILWDIIKNKLPDFKKNISKILENREK